MNLIDSGRDPIVPGPEAIPPAAAAIERAGILEGDLHQHVSEVRTMVALRHT